MRRIVILISFLIFAVSCLYAQDEQPRVAVVPFNSIGVSENDAQILSGLFETALVKTGSFSVIEQNQVKEIIDAQAYSMLACSDEACAIEFGELLAAQQIILGDVSMLGGKYIINAKIIDVQKGKNIKADNVEAESLADMTKATELLAFKLAGLISGIGESVQIARDFGEVMIETEPPGAEIYVNGVLKATSPDLIDRIPIGLVRIEAKKGMLYAVKDLTVSADTEQILLRLEEMSGNIFIKSEIKDAFIYLDGEKLMPLGNGFVEKVEIGEHVLEVIGSESMWKGIIEIVNGMSTKIDAVPRPFGTMSYNLPDGVHGEIASGTDQFSFRGEGKINVFSGNYDLVLSGGRFERYEEPIRINSGQNFTLDPELHTVKELEKEYLAARSRILISRLDESGPDSASVQEVVSEIDVLVTDLNNSEHSFPDLDTTFAELKNDSTMKLRIAMNNERLAVLAQERTGLEQQLELKKDEFRSRDISAWSLSIIGGVGLITVGIFASDYDENMSNISDLYDPDDVMISMPFNIGFGFITAGTGLLLINGLLRFIPADGDNRGELRKAIRIINKEIEELRLENRQ